VTLPGGAVREGGLPIERVPGVELVRQGGGGGGGGGAGGVGGETVLRVGGGRYTFVSE
jgi:hypothetical protein